MDGRVVVLAGGVGAARFLEGVVQVIAPERVTAIVNTGDDAEFWGLHVSPDLDIVTYTLAGLIDAELGWGLKGDTFTVLDQIGRFGRDTWFSLGDRDLAASIHRTDLLRRGVPLSEIADGIARGLGLRLRIVPMSDQRVATRIRTPDGWLAFQDYFVRRRQQDDVLEVALEGRESALPAPGVLEAIAEASAILLAPSNPIVSLGPILAVPGIREALAAAPARVVAVSPIVGGATIKGPADRMLRGLGHDVSPVGVARLFRDFLDAMVLDEVDAALAPAIAALGVEPVVAPTIMRGPAEKRELARRALDATMAAA
jgi:LPPG:FO 2-phospho-L-lactate transferase